MYHCCSTQLDNHKSLHLQQSQHYRRTSRRPQWSSGGTWLKGSRWLNRSCTLCRSDLSHSSLCCRRIERRPQWSSGGIQRPCSRWQSTSARAARGSAQVVPSVALARGRVAGGPNGTVDVYVAVGTGPARYARGPTQVVVLRAHALAHAGGTSGQGGRPHWACGALGCPTGDGVRPQVTTGARTPLRLRATMVAPDGGTGGGGETAEELAAVTSGRGILDPVASLKLHRSSSK